PRMTARIPPAFAPRRAQGRPPGGPRPLTALAAPECLPLDHKEPTCPASTTTPARSSPPTASLLASGPNSTATAPRGKATHVAAPMTAASVTTTPLAPRAAACTAYFTHP